MLVGYFYRSSLLLPHISQTGTVLFSLYIFASHVFVFLQFTNNLLVVLQKDKCIVIDWPMATAFVAVRSVTDVLFSVNILLQVCVPFTSILFIRVRWLLILLSCSSD